MSEEQVPGRSLKNMGWFLVISGFFGLTWLPNIAPFCCVFGLIGIVAGMVSSSGPAVSSDGRMVLKQDNTGQWSWVEQGQVHGFSEKTVSLFFGLLCIMIEWNLKYLWWSRE